MAGRPFDIRERTFVLASEVVQFCRGMERGNPILRRLSWQLLRAAGSVGANLEEAAAAQSTPDFISKNSIALKECREALYWLRLISESEPDQRRAASPLIGEMREIAAILGAIVVRAKSNHARTKRP
jgi:four helix bundle protein